MRIRKRIEFGKIKITQSLRVPEIPDENDENESPDIPDCGLKFCLDGENLPGYGPQNAAIVIDDYGTSHLSMGGWPETEISFNFPEDDLQRVNAWFTDDYHNVLSPESAALKKNRATAVLNSLKSYTAAATNGNLFTAPFRIGWRYKLKSGIFSKFYDCGIAASFMQAPLLPVLSASISDKTLYTRVQVRNVPGRLMMRCEAMPEIIGQLRDVVENVEIYATPQTELFDPGAEVTGIRTITVDGMPKRCWYYTRYDKDSVILSTQQNNDFRRICTISFDEIVKNDTFTPLPLASGTLSDFKKLPKPEESGNFIPDPPLGSSHTILTEPLDFGFPDDDKSLRSLYIRGIFPRDKIKWRIYGSRHRDKWHQLAEVEGPMLSGFLGMRWRWFRLEIESPYRDEDTFDAITVTFRL